MKTTARNQFAGTITALQRGPANTEVTLALRGGNPIVAMVASNAAQRMKLNAGDEAVALVKSSAVVLESDFAGFMLSAQNQLAGTLSRPDRGAVSPTPGVTLPGGQVVTASVTNDAVSALGMAVGQPTTAVFKSSAVMLAVPSS